MLNATVFLELDVSHGQLFGPVVLKCKQNI